MSADNGKETLWWENINCSSCFNNGQNIEGFPMLNTHCLVHQMETAGKGDAKFADNFQLILSYMKQCR